MNILITYSNRNWSHSLRGKELKLEKIRKWVTVILKIQKQGIMFNWIWNRFIEWNFKKIGRVIL